MPDTPLTEILKDFRSYRPGNHREFLEWVKGRASDLRLKEYAMKEKSSAGNLPQHAVLNFDGCRADNHKHYTSTP